MSRVFGKRVRVVTLFILMFLIIMPFVWPWESNQMTPEDGRSFVYQDKRAQIAYEEHGQIYIAGDDNLTDTAVAELWEGNGSEELPYIIEGYNITLPGMSGRCIEIHNISLHLTIRDCFIVRGSVGLYLENVTSFAAEGNSFLSSGTGVALFDSSHITLTSNYFDSSATGVFLTTVYDLYLADNIFESCSSYGVQGLGVSYSTIFNNSIQMGDIGMVFASGCVGNEIRRNSFADVTLICLEFGSDAGSNKVIWNYFGLCFQSAMDSSFGELNIFSYNYYFEFVSAPDDNNDGIYDDPYNIPFSTIYDYNPLKYPPLPPVWNQPLSDQNVEFGDSLVYDLSVISSPPIGDWYINDTLNFMIDDEGTIMDRGNLEVGVYSLEVNVTDLYGASIDGQFTVSVVDTVYPVWVTTPINQQFYYGEDIDIQIIAWDLSGIGGWTLDDEDNFVLTSRAFGEMGVATINSVGNLELGSYPLHVAAYDSNGLQVVASFTVSIVTLPSDGASLVWIVAPTGLAAVALVIALYAIVKPKQST